MAHKFIRPIKLARKTTTRYQLRWLPSSAYAIGANIRVNGKFSKTITQSVLFNIDRFRVYAYYP